MPILNNLTVNEIVSGQVPDYYIKRAITDMGYITVSSSTTGQSVFSTSPATNVANYALAGLMYRRAGVGNISVDCSSLTKISGQSAFERAFYVCSNVPSYDFSNLTEISGSYVFREAWAGYSSSGATSLSFPALTKISGIMAFDNALNSNTRITSVSMPALTNIGVNGLSSAFSYSGITTLTLGNTAKITLGSGALDYMFEGCSQPITVNAPAANQSDIEAMSGYPEFGSYDTVTWHWQS